MERSQVKSDEVARRGQAWYEAGIRDQVETPQNIGKMIIIDVETGEYAIDSLGIDAADRLHARHPGAALYGIRIGYNVAESLGGVMERVAPA
jgi:hypothetical protein